MAVLGAGTAMTQQVLVLIAQNSAGPGDLGVASSAATFTRTLGGAVGVAAFGAVISTRLHTDLPSALAGSGRAGQDVQLLLGTPERIAELPPALAEAVRVSYSNGLAAVFLIAVPLALAALVAVLLVRETPLGTS
ncbi:hypothetical protein ACFSVJ_27050 [Prauserella oleivorans]